MSALAVLTHRVSELRDSVAGRSEPLLDLGEVQDHLPVGPSVQRWRLGGPGTRRRSKQIEKQIVAFPLNICVRTPFRPH